MDLRTKNKRLYAAMRDDDWNMARELRKKVDPSLKTLRYANDHKSQEWKDLLGNDDFFWVSPKREQLYFLLIKGQWAEAQELLDEPVVPDVRTVNHAVRRLDTQWVQKLADALVAAGHKPTDEALDIAFKQRDEKKLDILIKAGAVPGEETLRDAVYCWSVDVSWVKKLLDAGAPATSDVFRSALTFPNLGKMLALIKAGAVPDEETMVSAIHELDSGWAEMLLEVRIVAGQPSTPDMLHVAVLAGKKDIAKTLLAQGVVPEEKTLFKNAAMIEMLCAAYNKATAPQQPAAAQPKKLIKRASPAPRVLKLSKTKGLSHG